MTHRLRTYPDLGDETDITVRALTLFATDARKQTLSHPRITHTSKHWSWGSAFQGHRNAQNHDWTDQGTGRKAPFPQLSYHTAAPGPGSLGPHRGAPRWLS